MFIATDIHADLAGTISGATIRRLGEAQSNYLVSCLYQLPKWVQETLINHAEGKIPSDAYVHIYGQRLEEAINIAKSLIDVDILTASSKPLSKLLAKVNGGTELSYDEILSRICREKLEVLKTPDLEIAKKFHDHIKQKGGEFELALLDCEKLLSQAAYGYEMAEFYEVALKLFFHQEDESEYCQVVSKLYEALRKRTYGQHFAQTIEETLAGYVSYLEESRSDDMMHSRAYYLFNELPIDASIEDIAWALNIPASEVEEKIPTAKRNRVEQLLYLGYTEMYELQEAADETARGTADLITDIKTTLQNI